MLAALTDADRSAATADKVQGRGGTAEKYSNPDARHRPYPTNQGLRAASTTGMPLVHTEVVTRLSATNAKAAITIDGTRALPHSAAPSLPSPSRTFREHHVAICPER
jgi:hypothetical protein